MCSTNCLSVITSSWHTTATRKRRANPPRSSSGSSRRLRRKSSNEQEAFGAIDQTVMKDLRAESFQVTLLGDFSKKFVTNTFFNVIGRSWSFIVNLLLTPYILSHLGVGDFGAWVLLTILISSFNLLDLGLGFSFVKYISAYHTYEDYN